MTTYGPCSSIMRIISSAYAAVVAPGLALAHARPGPEVLADGLAVVTLARGVAFADKFGGYASAQISLRVDDLSEIGRMMTALRETPPADVGGLRVEQIDDFANGFGRFPPNDILRIWVEGAGRIVVRPSGTEPKLKAYIDASSTEGTGRERLAAAEQTVATLERGMRELLGA